MSWSVIDRRLWGRPLHVPLDVLAAAPVGVEPHHAAVVVDLPHRATWALEIGARAGGHRHVPVDRDRLIGGVVGAFRVPRRRALMLTLAQPRLDHGFASGDRLVVRVVPVLDVVGEQRRDPLAIVGLPGLDVVVEPTRNIGSFHLSSSFQRSARRSSLPDAVRGSSATNSKRFGPLYRASDSAQWSRSWSASGAAPSRRTTTASTASCHSGSARPTAAASVTSGWRSRTASTSAGSTFSPPETITSPSRSST